MTAILAILVINISSLISIITYAPKFVEMVTDLLMNVTIITKRMEMAVLIAAKSNQVIYAEEAPQQLKTNVLFINQIQYKLPKLDRLDIQPGSLSISNLITCRELCFNQMIVMTNVRLW